MTEQLMALEVCCCGNCAAEGHEKEVYRPLTAEEIAQREADAAAYAEQQAALQAEAADKEAKRAAVIARLASAAGLEPVEIEAALSQWR